MLDLSCGNKYHESTNFLVSKLINTVQGNIKVSNEQKTRLKT